MKRSDKVVLIRNGTLAVLFIGSLIYLSVANAPFLKEMFSSSEALRTFVLTYGDWGVAVFMGFQMLHIFIPVIPGEVVQIAGGYIYGTARASAYLLIGTTLGTIAVFYVSRWIGYPLVEILVKPEKLIKMKRIMNSPKAELLILVLMLIPGFPKDTLIYVGGLSPMSPWRFILIALIGRIPCIVGSAYIGANMYTQNYAMVTVMAILVFAVIGVSVYFRKHPLFHLHHDDEHEVAIELEKAQ